MPSTYNIRSTLEMQRPRLPDDALQNATRVVLDKLAKRLNVRGDGSFAGRHEILGILEEEHHELKDAVWQGSLEDVRNELVDYAVGALWAIACIDSGAIRE